MKLAIGVLLGVTCLVVGYPPTGYQAAVGSYSEHDEAQLARITAQLAYDLMSQSQQEDSAAYSPLAISASLTMIYGAARGQAAQEISQVLGYQRYGRQYQVQQTYGYYLSKVQGYDGYDDVYGVYVQQGYPVQQSYRSMIQSYYQTPVVQVDFTDEGEQARQQINQRVWRETEGQIQEYLEEELDPQTNLYYLSAAISDQPLETQGQSQVYSGKFYNYGDSSQPSQVTMTQLRGQLPYYSTQEYQAVQIPYQGEGDIELLLVVPQQLNEPQQVQQSITPQTLQQILNQLTRADVQVQLPQVNVDQYQDLSVWLADYGVESAFSQSGDLSGISQSPGTYLSRVDHRALVELGQVSDSYRQHYNQQGEGSSYSHQVKADHPFLFYILDSDSGVILMAGYVNQV